jgi:hypothetical protein
MYNIRRFVYYNSETGFNKKEKAISRFLEVQTKPNEFFVYKRYVQKQHYNLGLN